MSKFSYAALLLTAMCWPMSANSQSGDTKILVRYKTSTVRVTPSPLIGGANVEFRITLHANGKVDDSFYVGGGISNPSGKNTRGLGETSAGPVYRVKDRSTITRTWDAGSHIEQLIIRVRDKSCSASYEFRLKPGQKEYRMWSTQLGMIAGYSSVKMTESTCTIE